MIMFVTSFEDTLTIINLKIIMTIKPKTIATCSVLLTTHRVIRMPLYFLKSTGKTQIHGSGSHQYFLFLCSNKVWALRASCLATAFLVSIKPKCACLTLLITNYI